MSSKVLVVDDDADFRDLARMIFEDHGINTVEAVDGETALAMIPGEKPDLVLLDILLPGMDGQQVLKKIKDDPATKNIPVVMCSTTFRDEKKVRQAKSLGAADYVKKPLPASELIKRVEKFLLKH